MTAPPPASAIRRGWLYLADLDPRLGTEPGKVRPVLVLQTDLLNNIHPSTIVLPLTTRVHKQAEHLRVHLPRGEGGLEEDSDILMDQIRAIDNRRFHRPIGPLSQPTLEQVEKNLLTLLDLEEPGASLS